MPILVTATSSFGFNKTIFSTHIFFNPITTYPVTGSGRAQLDCESSVALETDVQAAADPQPAETATAVVVVAAVAAAVGPRNYRKQTSHGRNKVQYNTAVMLI